MIKNRFIITENDRQNILSMYGLLVEQDEKEITISGVIKKNDEPLIQTKLTIMVNDSVVAGTTTDIDGKYNLKIKVGENEVTSPNFIFKIGKTYNVVIKNNELGEMPEDITIENNDFVKDFTVTPVKNIEEVRVNADALTSLKLNFTYNGEKLNNVLFSLRNGPLKIYENNLSSDNELFFQSSTGNGFVGLKEYDGSYIYYVNESKKTNYFEVSKIPKEDELVFTAKKDNLSFKKKIKFIKSNVGVNVVKVYDKNNKNIIAFTLTGINYKNNNNINIELEPTVLMVAVVNKENNPLPNAKVTFNNLGKVYTTDEKGQVNVVNINLDRVNYTVELENYKTMVGEIDIDAGKNEKTIKLISKSDESYDVDVTDEFKDGLFFIYGRSTANSYDNSLNNAKINAINKYIEKNKRKYKNVPEFTDQKIENWDLNYDVSKEVKDPKTKQTSVVIKFKKTDIKDYLEKFTKENKIKIDREKLELPSDILLTDAVSKAYRNNKKVFVVVGLNPKREPMDNTQTRTQEMVSKINRDKNLSTSIMNKTIPLFVNVDTNNSNYNELSTKTQIKSYPRVIILKPTNDKNFTVDLNTEYFNFEKDPSQLEKYL